MLSNITLDLTDYMYLRLKLVKPSKKNWFKELYKMILCLRGLLFLLVVNHQYLPITVNLISYILRTEKSNHLFSQTKTIELMGFCQQRSSNLRECVVMVRQQSNQNISNKIKWILIFQLTRSYLLETLRTNHYYCFLSLEALAE